MADLLIPVWAIVVIIVAILAIIIGGVTIYCCRKGLAEMKQVQNKILEQNKRNQNAENALLEDAKYKASKSQQRANSIRKYITKNSNSGNLNKQKTPSTSDNQQKQTNTKSVQKRTKKQKFVVQFDDNDDQFQTIDDTKGHQTILTPTCVYGMNHQQPGSIPIVSNYFQKEKSTEVPKINAYVDQDNLRYEAIVQKQKQMQEQREYEQQQEQTKQNLIEQQKILKLKQEIDNQQQIYDQMQNQQKLRSKSVVIRSADTISQLGPSALNSNSNFKSDSFQNECLSEKVKRLSNVGSEVHSQYSRRSTHDADQYSVEQEMRRNSVSNFFQESKAPKVSAVVDESKARRKAQKQGIDFNKFKSVSMDVQMQKPFRPPPSFSKLKGKDEQSQQNSVIYAYDDQISYMSMINDE